MAIRMFRPGGALSHPAFVRYCLARVASIISSQAQSVAVGWQVYALTGDAFDLGLVALAQFLPAALLVLVTGQIVDRLDRRKVLLACYALEFLCSVLLFLTALDPHPSEFTILAIVFLFGTARAFEQPTNQALMPNLVPREDFRNAVAVNSSASQTAIIVGPAIGGFLYLAGQGAAYVACGGMLITAAVLIAGLRYAPAARAREPVTWSSLLAGLSFIGSRKDILGAISLDLFAVLLGGATALLPVYAKDILQVGPTGLGMLRSAPAVGALTIALYLARWPVRRNEGLFMFAGVALFGVFTIVFAVSQSFILSLAALAIMGASDMASVFVRQTLVQLTTPDDMRGRVAAVNSVFIGTSNQLGDFRAGAMAAVIGTTGTVLFGGIGTVLVVGIWLWAFPALRKTDGIIQGS